MQIIVSPGGKIDLIFFFKKKRNGYKMGLIYFVHVFLKIPSSRESIMHRKPVQVIYFALCSSVLQIPSSI